MRKRTQKQSVKQPARLFGWGIVVLLVGGAIAIGLSGGHSTANANRADPVGAMSPVHTSTAPVGVPAIVPRLGAVHTGPAFTREDAVQYVTSHPMWRNLAPWTPPTIEKVEFLTSRQVSSLLSGESTGLPDNALLCYVQLRGTFTFSGSTTMVTYHTGFEVFDAHTGNFLMAGGL